MSVAHNCLYGNIFCERLGIGILKQRVTPLKQISYSMKKHMSGRLYLEKYNFISKG